MPGSPPRVYWDSCVFLSYFNGDTDRLPQIEALLKSASADNAIEIVTSTISITEVAFAQVEQTGKTDPAIEAAMDNLWADRSAVMLVGHSCWRLPFAVRSGIIGECIRITSREEPAHAPPAERPAPSPDR